MSGWIVEITKRAGHRACLPSDMIFDLGISLGVGRIFAYAVAPLEHGDDMRWNPNDDGINFNP